MGKDLVERKRVVSGGEQKRGWGLRAINTHLYAHITLSENKLYYSETGCRT